MDLSWAFCSLSGFLQGRISDPEAVAPTGKQHVDKTSGPGPLRGGPEKLGVILFPHFTSVLASQRMVSGQITTIMSPTSMSLQKGKAPQ